MSGVRAAASLKTEPRRAPSPEVAGMQDQLYEILATGVAPSPSVSIEAIERFLHEHAREPKESAQFEAFFARCGLTPSPTALPAPAEDGFELPELTEPRGLPGAVVRFIDDEDAPTLDPAPAPAPAPLHLTVDEELSPPLVVSARAGGPLLWTSLGLLAAALAAVLWLGHGVIRELRGELHDARKRAADNERMIDALQGRAATIESGIVQNGELMKRMDHKSDLVLQSLEQTREEQQRRPRWQR